MKNVRIFAFESPSDEILPRPSQPSKLAIFFREYEQTESYRICRRLQFLRWIEESRVEALLLTRHCEAFREVYAKESRVNGSKILLGTTHRQ